MRIVVTGGTGFIGRHVVAEALARGHDVTVLARSAAKVPDGVTLLRHDLRESEGLAAGLRGAEGVVHCAALLDGSFDDMHAVTVNGTRHLLEALDHSQLRRLVLLSTFALYDQERIAVNGVLDEASPLIDDFAGRHPYIEAKRAQETLVRALDDPSVWTILRPGLVHGPGREWFHHLGMQRGPTKWTCLAGDGLLPLTHVTNCATAAVLALEAGAAGGETLNIVDDDLPTRRAYVEALAARQSTPPAISELSWDFLDRWSARADWVRRVLTFGLAPLPGLLRPADVHARCKPLRYTNERAKTVLGWEPRALEL